MPVVHPAEVWQASGRYDDDRARDGPLQGPRRTRHGPRDDPRGGRRRSCSRDIVQRYRQLPMIVYHFQTKFRDEPRSRGGLIRVREFVMKDSYSCDRDEAGLDVELLARTTRPTTRIFERLGLEAIPVGSDVGMMGGSRAPTSSWSSTRLGEDTLVLCDDVRLRRQPADRGRRASPRPRARGPRCRWRRSRRRARRRSRRSPPSSASPKSKTAKAAFFVTGDGRLRRRHRPRRLRRQRDEAGQRASRPSVALRPATVEEIRAARHGGGLRLADRRAAMPSSSSTSSSPARRTLSPAPTGWAGTSGT